MKKSDKRIKKTIKPEYLLIVQSTDILYIQSRGVTRQRQNGQDRKQLTRYYVNT